MFHLRVADGEDLPALRALIDRSVRELSRAYYSPDQIASALVHVFGIDTQLLTDRSYYVVEVAGEIVAAGGWSSRRSLFGGDQHKAAEDPELDPARDPARIRAFFVDPAWTRRGLARLLFNACSAAALIRGFSALELAATLPGEPLYRALGFRSVEAFEVAMPDGQRLPLVRMARALEPAVDG